MAQKYTDQEIIQAFRVGGLARERAWEFAYKDWRARIFGTIASKNGTREEAKEAIQEVAMAFEIRVRRSDFVLQHKLSTYFIKCVYRQWLRQKKGQKMNPIELEDSHITDFVESIEADIAQKEITNVLDESLARLGERCKSILLYFIQYFSMKEIAEKMGFEGGEQVAKNEKKKCQIKYETLLRENPYILQQIQNLKNG